MFPPVGLPRPSIETNPHAGTSSQYHPSKKNQPPIEIASLSLPCCIPTTIGGGDDPRNCMYGSFSSVWGRLDGIGSRTRIPPLLPFHLLNTFCSFISWLKGNLSLLEILYHFLRGLKQMEVPPEKGGILLCLFSCEVQTKSVRSFWERQACLRRLSAGCCPHFSTRRDGVIQHDV